MKIFKVNDCDWVMATSAEEAKQVLATFTDVHEDDEVRELTDHELDTFKFIDEDHDEEKDGPHPTFRQELARRVAAGDRPDMFASTEY
jgi:hypothetical protein